MHISWNFLGIFVWAILVIYVFFIIHNIRQCHLKMIIQKRRKFDAKTTIIDVIEILIFILACSYMSVITFFDNPNFSNQQILTNKFEYQPLVLSTGATKSHYVTVTCRHNRKMKQSYRFFSEDQRITVKSNYASIAEGVDPFPVEAQIIPYNKKDLRAADDHYQKAYVAIYTATYKKNWQNGLGLHAGHVFIKYYLIRVPDRSFIKIIEK